MNNSTSSIRFFSSLILYNFCFVYYKCLICEAIHNNISYTTEFTLDLKNLRIENARILQMQGYSIVMINDNIMFLSFPDSP